MVVQQNEIEQFIKSMRTRIEQGNVQFGDEFMQRELSQDIEQELLDVANYAMLLAIKIRRLNLNG